MTLTATASHRVILLNTGVLTITGAATFITETTNKKIILGESNAFASHVTMQAGNGDNATFDDITFKDSGGVDLVSSAPSLAGKLFIDATNNLAVSGDLIIIAHTTGNDYSRSAAFNGRRHLYFVLQVLVMERSH